MQSTLEPAGRAAEDIASLFYWMTGGAVIIWLIVVGLAVYAIVRPGKHNPRTTQLFIIGGGAILPTIILTGLLCASLPMLPELQRPAPDGSLTIHVSGVCWWWRVEYEGPDGGSFVTANEIRLPVNMPIEFKLNSEDVIHSFWIPALGGKVDMIPGRQTRLKLHPTRVGTFRGACAEYCGTAHAQMNFDVIVMSQEDFANWVVSQREPAVRTLTPVAQIGRDHFFRSGCSACHTIRGTDADGHVGPDLTHFGNRKTIGAGILPNTHDNIALWIRDTDHVKPGVEMPTFNFASDNASDNASDKSNNTASAIASYLQQLN